MSNVRFCQKCTEVTAENYPFVCPITGLRGSDEYALRQMCSSAERQQCDKGTREQLWEKMPEELKPEGCQSLGLYYRR